MAKPFSAPRSFVIAFILVSSGISVVGCGSGAPDTPGALTQLVKPLEQQHVFPFQLSGVTVDLSDEKSSDLREIQFHTTGTCDKTLYVELDRKKLIGEEPGSDGFYQKAVRDAASLPPEKTAELEKLKAPPPKAGRFFRLVCKEGEPCSFRGSCTAKVVNGKWAYENVAVHQTAPLGAMGISAYFVNGRWQNSPTTSTSETLNDGRRTVLIQRRESPQDRFDLPGAMVEQIPTGGEVVDIHGPSFDQWRSQNAAAKNKFIEAVRSTQSQIWKEQFGDPKRLKSAISSSNKWKFATTMPVAMNWILEITKVPDNFGFTAVIRSEDGKETHDFRAKFEETRPSATVEPGVPQLEPARYVLSRVSFSPMPTPFVRALTGQDNVERLTLVLVKGTDRLQIIIGSQSADLTLVD